MKNLLALVALILVSLPVAAQEEAVEMADTMRSNGKIYVVVAVLMVIFTGIVIYLVKIDRKLSKLEKEDRK